MTSLILFFTLFLPLDRCWTLDAVVSKWRGDEPRERRQDHTMVSNQASAALISVVTQMYIHNWLCKRKSIAWAEESTALELALSASSLVSGWGLLLRQQRSLCAFLTKMTMVIEGPVPIIASVVPSPLIRFVCVFKLIMLHASFVIFLDLGSFPLICISALVAMLPGETWDVLLGPSVPNIGVAPGTPEPVGTPSQPAETFIPPATSTFLRRVLASFHDSENSSCLLCYWLMMVAIHSVSVAGLSCGFTCNWSAENLKNWPRVSVLIATIPINTLAATTWKLWILANGTYLTMVALATPVARQDKRIDPQSHRRAHVNLSIGTTAAITSAASYSNKAFLATMWLLAALGHSNQHMNELATAITDRGILAPAGLYSNVRDKTYDPSSHLQYIIVAGIARGPDGLPDSSRVMDYYPWPVQNSAPRSLSTLPSEPLSQKFPDTRWAASLGSGSTRSWETRDSESNSAKHFNHFWRTFAKTLCLQFADDHLEYFVIYRVDVGNLPRISLVRPTLTSLWQHSCTDLSQFNCTDKGQRYNCPWEPITTEVSSLLKKDFPPSRAEVELREALSPGVRVRFRSDLLTFDGKIRPGQTGTFNETNNNTPSVGVIWDEWAGPFTVDRKHAGLYFVHWEQLELITDSEAV